MEERGVYSYLKKGDFMKIMKIAGLLTAAILGIFAILLIGQLWGEWFEWSTFIKITISLGVTVIAIGIIALIWRELEKEKIYKKEDFID